MEKRKQYDNKIILPRAETHEISNKLAKKIKETFKKAKLKITYSPAPSDVVYIKLTFD